MQVSLNTQKTWNTSTRLQVSNVDIVDPTYEHDEIMRIKWKLSFSLLWWKGRRTCLQDDETWTSKHGTLQQLTVTLLHRHYHCCRNDEGQSSKHQFTNNASKLTISRSKTKKILGRASSPDPSLVGKGGTPSPYPTLPRHLTLSYPPLRFS